MLEERIEERRVAVKIYHKNLKNIYTKNIYKQKPEKPFFKILRLFLSGFYIVGFFNGWFFMVGFFWCVFMVLFLGGFCMVGLILWVF